MKDDTDSFISEKLPTFSVGWGLLRGAVWVFLFVITLVMLPLAIAVFIYLVLTDRETKQR